MESVFAKYSKEAWPYRFSGQLTINDIIVGGTPSDPKVAEGWIKSKLAPETDRLIQEAVAETMVARGITAEQAAEEVSKNKVLNGFKRDKNGLYVEGRQLKAAIKEAFSICLAAGKLPQGNVWGRTRKGLLSFVAEHVIVAETRLHLGVDEPTGVMQNFVHTFRGSGIKMEEYVEQPVIDFTIWSDWEFTEEQWGLVWLTAEQGGLGASRSQGHGRFTVTRWKPIEL